jgi:hypothetical protein
MKSGEGHSGRMHFLEIREFDKVLIVRLADFLRMIPSE